MRLVKEEIFLIVVWGLSALLIFFCEDIFGNTYPIQVFEVLDGDTVKAEIDLGFGVFLHRPIRISGVDTPELKTQPAAAKKAKQFTHEFTLFGPCEVTDPKVEKYGRVLADVVCGGKSLSEALVKEKLGKPYSGGKR